MSLTWLRLQGDRSSGGIGNDSRFGRFPRLRLRFGTGSDGSINSVQGGNLGSIGACRKFQNRDQRQQALNTFDLHNYWFLSPTSASIRTHRPFLDRGWKQPQGLSLAVVLDNDLGHFNVDDTCAVHFAMQGNDQIIDYGQATMWFNLDP
jgi:hypothetical protein